MRRTAANRTPVTYTTEKKRINTSSGRNPSQPNLDWYEKEPTELYECAFARVRSIKNQQLTRRYELFTYQQAYTSRYGPAQSANLFSPGQRNPSAGLYHVSTNVIKSCVDSAVARIAKSKPRAFVLPKRGNYRLKKACRNRTKFLDGAMQSAGVYANGEEVFRDACVYGDGSLLVYTEAGAIKSKVVKVDELWIEMVDGMKNDPTEMHYTEPVPKKKLLKRYPKFKKEIEEARAAWRGDTNYLAQSDMVEVCHSWKLPTEDGAGDGVHSITICTATLEKNEWKHTYFPVVRFSWSTPTYGPFGDGIAKDLFGMQRTILDILRGVVKSIRMFAVPRIWVDKMASVATQTVSNEISVNTYSGQPPKFDTPPAASPDIYQFIQWCIDWCYKQVGLSQLSAQSEKPAGLNSGVAMRTYQDVETQRFAVVGQRWERWYLQVARVMLDMAEDLYKTNKGKLSVTVPGRGFIEKIDWKDAILSRDQYDVQVWATSILPETPEGKLQAIEEYIQSGMMPRDLAIGQLNNPILNDWVAQETAAREHIEMCLSNIEEGKKYIAPDAIGNVDLAVQLSQAAVLNAENDNLEPEKIDTMVRWMTRALELQAAKRAAMQPPPGPPGPGGAPPGGGSPTVGRGAKPPVAEMAPQNGAPVNLPQAA